MSRTFCSAKMSGFSNEYCWLRIYAAIYWENLKEGSIRRRRNRRQNIIKMMLKLTVILQITPLVQYKITGDLM